MKKIILGAALMLSVATFAQKEEIKVLKKLDNTESQPTEKDMEKMSIALESLDGKVDLLSDDEKVLYHYFKATQPIMKVMMVAMKNPNDIAAIQKASTQFANPEYLESLAFHYNTLKNIEVKLGKNEYTNDIKPMIDMMKQQLSQSAFQLNTDKKYKEASQVFYSMYKFDSTNGSNLENAAILAVQAEDYKLAEKMYEEFKNSDYLNNGVIYYAMNIATDVEDTFPNRDARVKAIAIKTHEKPRDEKVSIKKPEVYKMLAIVTLQNGDVEKAKPFFTEAIKLNPTDKDLLTREFSLYFNEGYEFLKEDDKLVADINANVDNKTKYDELMAKRKAMFKRALPSFEKAYQINPTDENTKILLKTCYESLGMKDKATTIK